MSSMIHKYNLSVFVFITYSYEIFEWGLGGGEIFGVELRLCMEANSDRADCSDKALETFI